jgi:signal transduction histidine kinase
MIKTITFNFLLVFTWSITLAQNAEGVKHIETTKKELISSKADTNRVLQYVDKALEILFKGLRIAEKNNLPLETAICLNNAFYAVTEKAKQNVRDYEPTVSLRTRRLQDKIEINVRDNGNGIPASIKEKIFQPFFTTKPTGQGTGLGLSLAYDIVKAHGGEIKVETKEGEGTEFTIHLQNHATQ